MVGIEIGPALSTIGTTLPYPWQGGTSENSAASTVTKSLLDRRKLTPSRRSRRSPTAHGAQAQAAERDEGWRMRVAAVVTVSDRQSEAIDIGTSKIGAHSRVTGFPDQPATA